LTPGNILWKKKDYLAAKKTFENCIENVIIFPEINRSAEKIKCRYVPSQWSSGA
jgi:hypothetical protein